MENNASLIKDTARLLANNSNEKISPLYRTRVEEPLPSRGEILQAVELLRSALFPGYFRCEECSQDNIDFHIGSALEQASRILREQVRRSFCFFCEDAGKCRECRGKSADIVNALITRLPEIQQLLIQDVQAAYEGDPAAIHPIETVFCYPCITAITNQRLAHELYKNHVPLVPRLITEHAHSLTGIDIHPGAEIGPRFFIDHGTGVVIGETSVIGRNVKIYQGVTLGAKSFPLDENGHPIKGIKRHPNVEDDVTVYAEATILGAITIGKGSVIGGNVWVTKDVPPNSKISQQHIE